MNKIKRIIAVALAIVTVLGASAQFRFGPRVGVELNKVNFSNEVFNTKNRAGFTGGIMAEYTVPIINIAVDASIMYVHRNNSFDLGPENSNTTVEKKADYIEIPVNLKYKLGLPALGKVLSPYIFTGPAFAVKCTKEDAQAAIENKNFDVSWNFGLGLQFFQHLQIGASYGLGLSKVFDAPLANIAGINNTHIEGKNNCWTITAAYLF